MSSKRDDSAAAAPPRRRQRIATSLVVYYTAWVAVLLGAASALLYWDLRRDMLEQDRVFVSHKLQVLSRLLEQTPPDWVGLRQEALEEAEISQSSQTPFSLRVLDAQGHAQLQTPGMATALPIQGHWPAAAGPLRSTGPNPHMFVVAATRLTAGREVWDLQAALDVDTQARLLADYRRDIGIILTGGLLGALVGGTWLTRRGLRPLGQITAAAKRIGAQRLHDRVQRGEWPQELSELATAFDEMLDRLQESFERLSQFSADLAHELRTPITNLIGEAQVVLSRPRSGPEYERILHSSLEECGRLARMIDSMLFLAQADRAQTALQITSLEADAQLRAVAEFYQALADEQGVQLRCEGNVRIAADPLLLRRALSNLLSNALRYTPSGGQIALQAMLAEDGCPLLRVSDSGTGIAAEHLPQLGQRFYRIDPSRSRQHGGTGLGLAIVKSVMALHGGCLLLESQPGRGTRATLQFPTPPARQSQAA